MNRDEMIEEIMNEMKQMSISEKEEVLVVLQIMNGETPDDQAAVLRVKRQVMEMQKRGCFVDDSLIRFFTG